MTLVTIAIDLADSGLAPWVSMAEVAAYKATQTDDDEATL